MEVREKVINLIQYHLCIKKEKIQDDSVLGEELRMDELDGIALVMSLEEAFDIVIPDKDMEKYFGYRNTVKEVIDYIQGRIK